MSDIGTKHRAKQVNRLSHQLKHSVKEMFGLVTTGCTESPKREGRRGEVGHMCNPSWPRNDKTAPVGCER